MSSEDQQDKDKKFNYDQLRSIYSEFKNMAVSKTEGKTQNDYKFWDTQPVPKLDEVVTEHGPIEADKKPEELKKEPLALPKGFEWCELDLSNDGHLEELFVLLRENYVEDMAATFRFEYGKSLIRWALMPPGYKKVWHVGVRATASKKLLAFIGGTPVTLQIYHLTKKMVDIDFLCVHKKLRSKRLAPVLIKEITRRVHVHGSMFQAVYTAGTLLPKAVTQATYYHRSLNPKKLIETGFSFLRKNMTLARTIKLYRVADKPQLPGFRKLVPADIPQVQKLYTEYMNAHCDMYKVMDEEDARHFFTPVKDALNAYVVENPETHKITHFVSFYGINNIVVSNPKYSNLKTGFMWYYAAPDDESLKQLVNDALVMAHQEGFDCMNALDGMSNNKYLTDLKFAEGDGKLNFYLFNWKCPAIPTERQGFLVI